MNVVVAVLGTAGLVALILILGIMGRLTQRWEQVTRSKSHYHLFYAAATLLVIASLMRLVRVGYMFSTAGPSALSDPKSWVYLFLYHLPLAAGLTLSLIVTYRNWGWLLRERN